LKSCRSTSFIGWLSWLDGTGSLWAGGGGDAVCACEAGAGLDPGEGMLRPCERDVLG
jgi:hypothetical protein